MVWDHDCPSTLCLCSLLHNLTSHQKLLLIFLSTCWHVLMLKRLCRCCVSCSWAWSVTPIYTNTITIIDKELASSVTSLGPVLTLLKVRSQASLLLIICFPPIQFPLDHVISKTIIKVMTKLRPSLQSNTQVLESVWLLLKQISSVKATVDISLWIVQQLNTGEWTAGKEDQLKLLC